MQLYRWKFVLWSAPEEVHLVRYMLYFIFALVNVLLWTFILYKMLLHMVDCLLTLI